MDWLHHPRYVPHRDRLIEKFRKRLARMRVLKQVVFLCGGRASARRDRLRDYIRAHHPQLLVFYADDVWTELQHHEGDTALEVEHNLAQLADVLVIVVESAGTFTELGAFALHGELRKKLLPILDRLYQHEASFINTGPVPLVDRDSKFRPCIHSDFNVILNSASQLDDRLERMGGHQIAFGPKTAQDPKRMLLLLFDLLAIISPAPKEHCEFYVSGIVGMQPACGVDYLLGLGIALRVFKTKTDGLGRKYYVRSIDGEHLEAYQHGRWFDLASARARHIGVLQSIDDVAAILDEVDA